jgi:Uma2 family endonuclease
MVNLAYDNLYLPAETELPHSDDTPVDNELQNEIPNFILNLLRLAWEERQDWFFGVDMAVYYHPQLPAIVPDGFLAMGVPRYKSEAGRLSYMLWHEEKVMPILALEVVSEKYNGEYEQKLETYQELGILYYVIYNPLTQKRRKHKHRASLEVYKLVEAVYQLVSPNSQGIMWLPEIGFGMGCELWAFVAWEREWLFLYDQDGIRYLTDKEVAAQERQGKIRERLIANQERIAKQEAEQGKQQAELAQKLAEQKAQRLAKMLEALGVDPEQI